MKLLVPIAHSMDLTLMSKHLLKHRRVEQQARLGPSRSRNAFKQDSCFNRGKWHFNGVVLQTAVCRFNPMALSEMILNGVGWWGENPDRTPELQDLECVCRDTSNR